MHYEDRYVIQIDGGTIVSPGINGVLLNGHTVLANFDPDYKTNKLMIKPNKPGGKITWFSLRPVGEGKYYEFFLIVDKAAHSVIFLANEKCKITITLNDF